MEKNVIGLVNLHNSPELGQLTTSRTLGSTSFLGRYALMDFALSNFCNSGIDIVGIMVRDFPRSVLGHLGSMTAFIENTKIGKESIMYNESGIMNPPYNHDINNLRTNPWIFHINAEYVVIQPAHIVSTIDFAPILKEHIERKEKITAVYATIDNADETFSTSNCVVIDDEGYVKKFEKNTQTNKHAQVSMETYIINRSVLAEIINKQEKTNALYGLKEMIALLAENTIPVHAHEYKGFVRCYDSIEHYMEYVLEVLDLNVVNALFKDDWPIYTLTHDTPPAKYGKFSKVKNSYVANGAVINGQVEGSIISRNVIIEKGATVKNSIILARTFIGSDVVLDGVIVDKNSHIINSKALKGNVKKPIYIPQGVNI